MNLKQIWTLYSQATQLKKLNQQGAPMMKYVPVVTSIALALIALLAAPAFVANHVQLYLGIWLALAVGHALLPSLIPAIEQPAGLQIPSWATLSISSAGVLGGVVSAPHWLTSNVDAVVVIGAVVHILQALLPAVKGSVKSGTVACLALLAICATPLYAQDATAASPDQLIGIGPSLAIGASPMAAGTGLYAKKIAGTETYSVNVVDVTPNADTPGTVTTNVATGIGQKIADFNMAGQKLNLYATTEVGFSYSGSNVGWSWTGGGMVPFTIKGHEVAIAVRWNKSSVSNGTGYQIKPTILYCWKR